MKVIWAARVNTLVDRPQFLMMVVEEEGSGRMIEVRAKGKGVIAWIMEAGERVSIKSPLVRTIEVRDMEAGEGSRRDRWMLVYINEDIRCMLGRLS